MANDDHRQFEFEVAVSFSGKQHRDYVREVVEIIAMSLTRERVFFDEWYEDMLAGHDADEVLQDVYLNHSRLVVAFFGGDYEDRAWTQEEWRAIKDLERRLRDAAGGNVKRMRLLMIRLGPGTPASVMSTAIVPDYSEKKPSEAASLILKRLRRAGGGAPHAGQAGDASRDPTSSTSDSNGSRSTGADANDATGDARWVDREHVRATVKALKEAPAFFGQLQEAVAIEASGDNSTPELDPAKTTPQRIVDWFCDLDEDNLEDAAMARMDAAHRATLRFREACADDSAAMDRATKAIARTMALAAMGLVLAVIKASDLDARQGAGFVAPFHAADLRWVDALICKLVDGVLNGGRVDVVLESGQQSVRPLRLCVIAPNDAVSEQEVECLVYEELFADDAETPDFSLDHGSGRALSTQHRLKMKKFLRTQAKFSGYRYSIVLGANVPSEQLVVEHGSRLGVIVSDPRSDQSDAALFDGVAAELEIFVRTWRGGGRGGDSDGRDHPSSGQPPDAPGPTEPGVSEKLRQGVKTAAEVSKDLGPVASLAKTLTDIFTK